MCCKKSTLLTMLNKMAEVLAFEKEYLTELDTKIGDADHGLSMHRGFQAVIAKLPEVADQCAGTILKTVGMTLVSTVGGASGPLYGTAFMYAGNQVVGKEELTLADAANMFNAALDGITKRGKANPGDKTMLETLVPVTEYLLSLRDGESEPNSATIWQTVLQIAHEGMESTRPLEAKKGRSSFLKERSIGHLDPGAVSSYLLIKVIAEAMIAGAGVAEVQTNLMEAKSDATEKASEV